MITARPYQNRVVQSLFDYFIQGNLGNPLIASPTGTGKSLMIALIIRQMLFDFPNTRVLVATHVKELIEQNVAALRTVWASAPIGINSAGLSRRNTIEPIIYCGIGSVYKAAQQLGWRDILFVDECHLISSNDDSMYQKFIADLAAINPSIRVVGFSATPFRVGQGLLTNGNIFTDICCDLTSLEAFNNFIDEYYLCPLIPKQPEFQYDVSDVKVTAGEFNQRELNISVDQAVLTRRALLEAIELGRKRNKWLVFASGVPHAEHINEELNRLGITSTLVTNKVNKIDRENRLKAHKEGLIKAIVNNSVLTTGYDDKGIDLIVDLGPTMSPGRHVQKYGRGTRPIYHPAATPEDLEILERRRWAFENGGKPNCLVLDFAANTKRLGPINDPVIPQRKNGTGTGEVPIKVCEVCGAYNHISARECCDCGTEFIFRVKIRSKAGEDPIIYRPKTELITVDVLSTDYKIHHKNGKPPSLQCNYFCGNQLFREWVCFEHTGLAKHKAHEWWRQRNPHDPPATVDEAIALVPQLRAPKQLRVLVGGKYPEIQECIF